MRLIDHDTKVDREFQASLHGARLEGSHVGGIGGTRRSFIDKLKRKGR
jgi:hypothetical protein